MKNLKYAALVLILSCGLVACKMGDNYPEPQETFRGAFIDKDTKQPFQTEIGGGGIRIRMMEYSWSDKPQPYDFNVKMDGTFNNTKIFKGDYGVTPSGAFVPIPEEKFNISGVVEKTYEIEPLLRIEWVGEPIINVDGTVTVNLKVTRGTNNPSYNTQNLVERALYISEVNYVGKFSYSANYSLIETGNYTIPSGGLVLQFKSIKPFPTFARKYFLRLGGRLNVSIEGGNYMNYSTIKEIDYPGR